MSAETPKFSHLDENHQANMVDVSEKEITARTAIATGSVYVSAETMSLIRQGNLAKGDLISIVKIAGIMGAKKTSELIPLCHPLPLTKVDIEISLVDDQVQIRSFAKVKYHTGVEMEALTAVAVAGLTIIDMVKSVDPLAYISDVKLVEKTGGKSGNWKRA